MNQEFLNIIGNIIDNIDFKKLEREEHHHCISRYEHSCNVAYATYKTCKRLKLDYVSATRAAIVHDFFFNSNFSNSKDKLLTHSKHSIINASKIMCLSDKEKDMIASHMFPVGGEVPKTKEGFILDLCDDVVSIKEKLYYNKFKLEKVAISMSVILFNIFK